MIEIIDFVTIFTIFLFVLSLVGIMAYERSNTTKKSTQ